MSIKSLRINALMESYKQLVKCGRIDNNMTITASMRILVESPAPSFFLTLGSVRNYIYSYEKGKTLKGEMAVAMQEQLYKTYLTLREQHPDWMKEKVIELVAEQPAPRYYINHITAMKLLFWQTSPQTKKSNQ